MLILFDLSRYRENNEILKKGMCELGFKQLYKDTENPQGYLTTSFRFPTNPLFVFEEFQSRLSDYGKFMLIRKINKSPNFK